MKRKIVKLNKNALRKVQSRLDAERREEIIRVNKQRKFMGLPPLRAK